MNTRFLKCLTPVLLLVAAVAASTPEEKSSNSIRILTLDWTSQVVLSHIAGRLLQGLGYEVEYLARDADSQWFLLSSDYADLQMEVWEGSMGEQFVDVLSRGLIVNAGTHSALTREDWWYPEYVKTHCPGLPDWRLLNDCAELFGEEGSARGIYYTGPWEKPDRARIRALGLNFDVIQLRDSTALRNKLEEAVKARKPVMIFNWTPNWIEAVHPGEFVEFPEYSLECESNPAWGVNPQLAWDCGNPRDGWLKKAVSRQLHKKHPCAYRVIRRLDFENKHIAAAAALVELDGLSPEQAAQRWLQENPYVSADWLDPVDCAADSGARVEY